LKHRINSEAVGSLYDEDRQVVKYVEYMKREAKEKAFFDAVNGRLQGQSVVPVKRNPSRPKINTNTIYIPKEYIQQQFQKRGIRSFDDNRLKPIIEKFKSGELEVIHLPNGLFKLRVKPTNQFIALESQIAKMNGSEQLSDVPPNQKKSLVLSKRTRNHKITGTQESTVIPNKPVEDLKAKVEQKFDTALAPPKTSSMDNGGSVRPLAQVKTDPAPNSDCEIFREKSLKQVSDYSGSDWGPADDDLESQYSTSTTNSQRPPSLIFDDTSDTSSVKSPSQSRRSTFPVFRNRTDTLPPFYNSGGTLSAISNLFGSFKEGLLDTGKSNNPQKTPFAIERFLDEDATAYNPYAAYRKSVNV
jgi:hypothetical protein